MSSKQEDKRMPGAIAGDIIGSVYEHRNIKKTQFPLFHPLCRFTDENLRETRERYREQVVNNTEVLDAVTLRLQTYTDYYNAFYAVLQDQFRLRRSVGAL
jgi:hypothetical protein